jgi:hypothetical protein
MEVRTVDLVARITEPLCDLARRPPRTYGWNRTMGGHPACEAVP